MYFFFIKVKWNKQKKEKPEPVYNQSITILEKGKHVLSLCNKGIIKGGGAPHHWDETGASSGGGTYMWEDALANPQK